jgi:hypothetical protein
MKPIIAELYGSNFCRAEGITLTSDSPVLALCRALVKAGHDPATPLEAYRGEVLCLRVRSIGEGAELSIAPDACGKPVFVRWRDRETIGAGSYSEKKAAPLPPEPRSV